MIWCFIICFGWQEPKPPLQTYCASYVQTVQKKEELEHIMKLPRSLRNRIQGNDLDYLCRCKGWKDSVCQKKKTTA